MNHLFTVIILVLDQTGLPFLKFLYAEILFFFPGTPSVPALGKLNQAALCKFKDSMVYAVSSRLQSLTVRWCLKRKKNVLLHLNLQINADGWLWGNLSWLSPIISDYTLSSSLSPSRGDSAVPVAGLSEDNEMNRCFICHPFPWFLLTMPWSSVTHLKWPFISGIRNLHVPGSRKKPENHVWWQLSDSAKASLQPLCHLLPVCPLCQAWLVRMSSLDLGCCMPPSPSSTLGWLHSC